MKRLILSTTLILAALGLIPHLSAEDTIIPSSIEIEEISVQEIQPAIDTSFLSVLKPEIKKGTPVSPYWLPYSFKGRTENWKQMWDNTALLSGAFISTLVVLETLPEGSTNWSRAEMRSTPFYERWWNHVSKGPAWDHDGAVFNYLLHPYAGAVYFMSARSCGFNFWGSLLYSFVISDVFWEFGIEATMERPSVQDLIITPVIGSLIGEGFYKLKHHIAVNDYELLGSRVFGHIVAFVIDPVNEFMDLFRTSGAHQAANVRRGFQMNLQPTLVPGGAGFSFACTF